MVSLLLYRLPSDRACKVLFMVRRIDEVVRSQAAMLGPTCAGKADEREAEAVACSETHLRKVVAWLDAQPNLAVLYCDYRHALLDPSAVAAAVDGFLGAGLDVRAMAGAVDPSLYRQRNGTVEKPGGTEFKKGSR